MISCTEFIAAYSELFRFLEKRGGQQAVRAFWEHLADQYLGTLKDLVTKHGLRGCWMYWSRTLSEEAAGFTMQMDEQEKVLRIEMHNCPSKARLLQWQQMEPYHDYCGHCDVLYQRVLEPLGYVCELDLTRVDQAC